MALPPSTVSVRRASMGTDVRNITAKEINAKIQKDALVSQGATHADVFQGSMVHTVIKTLTNAIQAHVLMEPHVLMRSMATHANASLVSLVWIVALTLTTALQTCAIMAPVVTLLMDIAATALLASPDLTVRQTFAIVVKIATFALDNKMITHVDVSLDGLERTVQWTLMTVCRTNVRMEAVVLTN